MRVYKLFVLAIFSLIILSCGDSEECVQLDWVGTYTGTAECNGVETTATVIITANGAGEIIIRYDTPTVITTFDPMPFDNCSADRSSSFGGNSASLSVRLEGDELTLVEKISGGGIESDCVVNAIKD